MTIEEISWGTVIIDYYERPVAGQVKLYGTKVYVLFQSHLDRLEVYSKTISDNALRFKTVKLISLSPSEMRLEARDFVTNNKATITCKF